MDIRHLARRIVAAALVLAGCTLGSCGPADYYGTVGVTGVGVGVGVGGVGLYADFPYPYYPTPYYDSFAYGPVYRGWPTYHLYPNLGYYLNYRPIYPG